MIKRKRLKGIISAIGYAAGLDSYQLYKLARWADNATEFATGTYINSVTGLGCPLQQALGGSENDPGARFGIGSDRTLSALDIHGSIVKVVD